MPTLDLPFIRSQYPAFQHPETSRWAFFENAGGSYVPRQVSDELYRFFTEYKAQPYGHAYIQKKAGQSMDAGYDIIARMINADPSDISLGPSTTMNLYVLAQAIRSSLSPGDEIIVTNQDHEANNGCWRRLEEFGIVIREWRVDPASGELDINELDKLVNTRTRLLCFSLCSNIVGTVNDVKAVCDIARSVGATTIADGVSFAPHQFPDVSTLGPDFIVFSTYKTFATHLGVLWGRPELMEKLTSQAHYFKADSPRYKLNPAGPQHAEIGALGGLGQYIEALHHHHFPDSPGTSLRAQTEDMFSLFSQHETELANRILEFAQDHHALRMVGGVQAKPHRRVGTISLIPAADSPDKLAQALATEHVAVGAGHFYALRCLEGLDVEPDTGVLRISLVHYNSHEDVDQLLNALDIALPG